MNMKLISKHLIPKLLFLTFACNVFAQTAQTDDQSTKSHQEPKNSKRAPDWVDGDVKKQKAKYDRPFAQVGNKIITYGDLRQAYEELGFIDCDSKLAKNAAKHYVIALAIAHNIANKKILGGLDKMGAFQDKVRKVFEHYKSDALKKMFEDGAVPYVLCEYIIIPNREKALRVQQELDAGKTIRDIKHDGILRNTYYGIWLSTQSDDDFKLLAYDMVYLMQPGETSAIFEIEGGKYMMFKLCHKSSSFAAVAWEVFLHSKFGAGTQFKEAFAHAILKQEIMKLLQEKKLVFFDFETGNEIDESKEILKFYKDF